MNRDAVGVAIAWAVILLFTIYMIGQVVRVIV
ncbi:membrane protein [Gordonia phage Pons]|uniref:Membrane protein n=1 Tax=Gordonia phage Pons TaxID=2885976 RepID=A0AAE8Y8T2_9CAUD|nr:membrane protein [Gordonia phage Pons]UDL15199.1 membrane protein [Gordonia phage Pons]